MSKVRRGWGQSLTWVQLERSRCSRFLQPLPLDRYCKPLSEKVRQPARLRYCRFTQLLGGGGRCEWIEVTCWNHLIVFSRAGRVLNILFCF